MKSSNVGERWREFLDFIKPFKNRAYTQDTADVIEKLAKSLLEAQLDEVEREKEKILYALALMWNQYCKGGHQYMTAGEQTQIVLQENGLIGDEESVADKDMDLLERGMFLQSKRGKKE